MVGKAVKTRVRASIGWQTPGYSVYVPDLTWLSLISCHSADVYLFVSRSPFYGEDFYCEIPRSFRHLSFYIFDRDVFRRDSIIGMYFALVELIIGVSPY